MVRITVRVRPGSARPGVGGKHDGTLVVNAGKRYTNLKPSDLESYIGKRAQRGLKLPRGFQNVSSIQVIAELVM